jgi:hypothetical protein
LEGWTVKRKRAKKADPLGLVDLVIVGEASALAADICNILIGDDPESGAKFLENQKTYWCARLMAEQGIAIMRIMYNRGCFTPEDREWKFLRDRGYIPKKDRNGGDEV